MRLYVEREVIKNLIRENSKNQIEPRRELNEKETQMADNPKTCSKPKKGGGKNRK